jgi:predicted MFS family arabinose efflux permease
VSGWRPPVLLAFGVTVVSLALFVAYAGRSREPLVPLGLFRSVPLSAGVAVVLLMGMASFGTIFFLALYLQQVLGLDPLRAGTTLVSVTALFVASAPLGGLLNRRYGPRVPMLGGLVLNGAAMLALSRVGTSTSVNSIWPLLLLFGFGLGFVMPTATAVILGNAPERLAGIAGGLQHTAAMLGTALGTAVFGSIISWRTATNVSASAVTGVPADTAPTAAAFTEGLRIAILVAVAFAVVSMALALLTNRTARPAPEVADAAILNVPQVDGQASGA